VQDQQADRDERGDIAIVDHQMVGDLDILQQSEHGVLPGGFARWVGT
jgi:hypothetical protein